MSGSKRVVTKTLRPGSKTCEWSPEPVGADPAKASDMASSNIRRVSDAHSSSASMTRINDWVESWLRGSTTNRRHCFLKGDE